MHRAACTSCLICLLAGPGWSWAGTAPEPSTVTASIAFVSIRAGDAHIYVNDGKGPDRRLTLGNTVNTQPALAVDGRLAYVSQVNGLPTVFLIDQNESNPRRLTGEARAELAPSWSPDGRALAYYSMESETGVVELRVHDFERGKTVSLPGHLRGKGPGAVTWSADGTRMAFLGEDDKGRNQVWVVQRDGSKLREVSSKFAPRGAASVSLSPDGRTVAWVADLRGQTPIVLTELAGGESRSLTLESLAGYESPRWSPDGRQLVFASTRDDPLNARNDIFVMAADGSQLRNLSRHPHEDFDPKWSADGHSVVFASLRSGSAQLYEVRLDSGVTRALSNHGSHDLDHVVRPLAALR